MDAQQTQESAADRPLHVFEIGPDTFIAHDAGKPTPKADATHVGWSLVA